MGWYGDGASDGMWVLTGIFWIVLVISLFWMMIRAMPWKGQAPASSMTVTGNSPEEILDQRFARGELDEQAYREQRAVLLREREKGL
jgi:putative membrane protein